MCKQSLSTFTGCVPLSRALTLYWLQWTQSRWWKVQQQTTGQLPGEIVCKCMNMKQDDAEKEQASSAKPSCEQWIKKTIHPASVFPALFVSSFLSCPLSPPHDVTGDSREAPEVIHPLAITNTCFDRWARASTRKPLHARTDLGWHSGCRPWCESLLQQHTGTSVHAQTNIQWHRTHLKACTLHSCLTDVDHFCCEYVGRK